MERPAAPMAGERKCLAGNTGETFGLCGASVRARARGFGVRRGTLRLDVKPMSGRRHFRGCLGG
jgi:hypothetical protein